MTDQQHPITPPPELVQQWLSEYFGTTVTGKVSALEQHIATQAARWGADQELEACITWVAIESLEAAKELRAARRPKPPSLKAQALDALNLMLMFIPPGDQREQGETIRKALEQLDD